ncbi:transmembrane signal receptor [Lithospermum erythrorhizon]|uniref:Transmembrane signal receptor n=1 Tax=Lithospermum erythrorhizon TaxID=34254 RepID=A0AAV3PRE1_LITER
MVTRSKVGTLKPRRLLNLNTTTIPDPTSPHYIPSSFSEALKYLHWKQNVIGIKWTFRVKLHPNGTIERYKAHLVAQGFKQLPGIDYDQTFSPVIKPTAIRLILSGAIFQDWPIRQLDVKNAFLNGRLTETVYLKQPPDFVHPDYSSHVCLLHKSLYGLKQGPLYLLVYVDDIIITGSSDTLLTEITSHLNSAFSLKDIGLLSYFLGIQVTRSSNSLFLSQQKYIRDLCELQLCSHTIDPIDATPLPNASEYRQLVEIGYI